MLQINTHGSSLLNKLNKKEKRNYLPRLSVPILTPSKALGKLHEYHAALVKRESFRRSLEVHIHKSTTMFFHSPENTKVTLWLPLSQTPDTLMWCLHVTRIPPLAKTDGAAMKSENSEPRAERTH